MIYSHDSNQLLAYVITGKPTQFDPSRPPTALMNGTLQGTFTEDPVGD